MKKKLASLLALVLTLSLSSPPAAALELEDAKKLLRQQYVDEIPEDILSRDTLEQILDALNDPYTVYMSPEEHQRFLSSVNGETVVGIGVSLQNAYDNGFQIMSVLPDSPALEAGLEAGDRIVAVNGTALTSTSDVRALIVGEEGTTVTITVVRQADGQQRDYTLARRSVVIPIVTYDQVGDAGFIDCVSFGESTVETIQEALETLDKDVSVWLMDLRGNPGGTSEAAAGSAGLFEGGAVMAYFRNAAGQYSFIYTLPSCPDLTDKPLIILTSAHSASGSELFAAAARDHGFGIAIGQRTFGKGIAQLIFDETNTQGIFEGDALKITTYRFFSPDGATNHIVGILPTLLISPEHTASAALLLSAPEPERANGSLKLELAGHTFYIDLTEARKEENTAAFTELLEALPPAAKLYKGSGAKIWSEVRPAGLAAELKLKGFASRCSFNDLTDDVAEREQIETLACYGLVSGYEDGAFLPQASITRAEFCALLANALNLPANEKVLTFSDIGADAWYAPYVSAMAARGLIAGCGDGAFRPDASISYQEAVTILSAAAAWVSMDGYALSQEELSPQDWISYHEFAEWAQTSARNLTELGVALELSQPAAPATRAQAAGLLFQFLEATHLLWDSAARNQ